ncbi:MULTISPECIES: hypothetical protein [Arcobacter]|uniref:DUF945 domain-containing protein n=1 Tax=Arcobacter ellisii TaxID=913109 RepID=A0A347U9B3_9BACT|nr:hypothetical protein [Arcobacter ellisii]AXX95441.1 hypothetical protein AELL_1788 [Arcobacter ellisii]RXI29909.1 hypothetical protein CP962_09605 [Arcobacter ellisii]
MKKLVLGAVAILVAVIAVVIGFKIKSDSLINAKIEELKNNGFVVKHQQSSNYLKTTGSGQIEVVYPDKVTTYLFSKIKNEEIKKTLEKQYSLLETVEKVEIFEGITFDYDFVINNLSFDANTNIYLSSLSKKAMYTLTQESTNIASSKWLLDFLKDKKLKVSIDKNANYKIADIDTVIPELMFLTIRGLEGNSKNMKLGLLKLSGTEKSDKDFFQLNDLNVDYNFDDKKEISNSTIKNIEFQDFDNSFNIKNILINSNTIKDEVNISGKSEIGFDEVNVKKYGEEVANLKKTTLNFTVDKLPIKKLDEITSYLEDENYKDYVKTLFQSGISVSSNGSATTYMIKGQKIFDTLKYDLSLGLNKNGSIEDAKNVKDIFETIKLVINLDNETAQNLKNLLNLKQPDSQVDFIDGENNLKKFEAELKTDGVYVNGKKVLEEKELELPKKKSFDDSQYLGQNTNGKGVFYDYELIGDNLLKVTFRYVPDMSTITSGGISVSFPELKDATRIKKHTTNSFEKINFYDAGSEIWNGGLEKNIISSYLLVEGWDENWTDATIEKEFSLEIDVKDLDVLQINLRGGALNDTNNGEKASEIVPVDGELDQQNYPIQIADIEIYSLKK